MSTRSRLPHAHSECAECSRLWSEYTHAHSEYMRLLENKLTRIEALPGDVEEQLTASDAHRRLSKHRLDLHQRRTHS